MDFVEWWKNSSKTASEAHYALRFDANEIGEIRCEILSDSAKSKVQGRLNSLKKRNKLVLIGCGIPILLIGLSILVTLGFFFFRALSNSIRNPIAWAFVIFFVLATTAMLIFFIKVLFQLQKSKTLTAIDLKGSKVGIESGKVFIKIERTKNSFNIIYSINSVPFTLLDDAIGWEIHTHFFGSPNITGQKNRETDEIYNFYFLPQSRILLHFELA